MSLLFLSRPDPCRTNGTLHVFFFLCQLHRELPYVVEHLCCFLALIIQEVALFFCYSQLLLVVCLSFFLTLVIMACWRVFVVPRETSHLFLPLLVQTSLCFVSNSSSKLPGFFPYTILCPTTRVLVYYLFQFFPRYYIWAPFHQRN